MSATSLSPSDEIPVIFIHYGNSPYLKYTMEVTKVYNPQKAVYLLGDEANAYLSGYGIKHVPMAEYMNSEEIDRFNKVFKIVGAKNYAIRDKDNGKTADNKGSFWTKFVFLKLFIIYNFAKGNHFKRFWIFDSDNMIVSNLKEVEPFLSPYDNTEKNEGYLMTGLINNLEVLKGYIDEINNLFEDEPFLEQTRKDLANAASNWAYTEMRAYNEYKRRKKVNAFDFTQVFLNSTFDRALAYESGMECTKLLPLVPNIKRVFIDKTASFFFKAIQSGEWVKVRGFDCSWIPLYIVRKLHHTALNEKQRHDVRNGGYKEIHFNESLIHRINRVIFFHAKRLKSRTKPTRERG